MSLFSKIANTEQAQHHTGGNYVYAHTTSDYFLFVLLSLDDVKSCAV